MALARFLDHGRELPEESRALDAGLRLFGVTRFHDGQMDAVLGALRGESLLVIRPTGGGKSLCFQLPAILKGQPTTFVLSPLKTLMVDQTKGLHKRKLPATFINSDIGSGEKQARYELLEQGAWALIYMAPERFGNKVNQQEVAWLGKHRPSFLVVDEAHLVDRWGADFRIDYSRIAEIRRRLGNPPVIACTATAGVETQRRILDSLGIPEAQVLVSGVDRPNIALVRMREPEVRLRAQIVADLLAKLEGRAMIFIPTMKEGKKVQAALASVGCKLPLFHSKLERLERDSIQARFSGQIDPPLNAIITTSAFSMGVDIPDVRLVVHWQHPASVEDYLQEFGRAGRDGKPALALLFTAGERDIGLLEYMAERTAEEAVESGMRSAPEAQTALAGRVRRIQEMQRLVSESDRCFRSALLEILQGPRSRQRRSVARWLLDLVFSSRTRVAYAGACCDHCQPELGQRIRTGTFTPGDKLARRWRIGWRKLWRRLWTALAVLLVFAVIWGAFIDPQKVASGDRAATLYRAYVARHYPRQRFTTPRVRTYRGYDIACATPRRHGSSTLCLLIDPARPNAHAVRGAFRRNPHRHFACTGEAQRLRIC
ncbi:MAG: RecQ family ATP-dependent DNA helicase [Solirubrobacteraceae bacterium]